MITASSYTETVSSIDQTYYMFLSFSRENSCIAVAKQ